MAKIFCYVAGKTLDSHKKFLQKLINEGGELVESLEDSNVTVVFCPIVSRFESDVSAALKRARGKHAEHAARA